MDQNALATGAAGAVFSHTHQVRLGPVKNFPLPNPACVNRRRDGTYLGRKEDESVGRRRFRRNADCQRLVRRLTAGDLVERVRGVDRLHTSRDRQVRSSEYTQT